jgi:hypothetical protein
MEYAGVSYGKLVYFIAIWYILRQFGKCYGYLLCFVPFWYVVKRKIWQPCFNCISKLPFSYALKTIKKTFEIFFPNRSVSLRRSV